MKCEYCGGTSWTVNVRNGVECSGCGHPRSDVNFFQTHPFYVMSVPEHLSEDAFERLRESWNEIFKDVNKPKLIILEEGITISPLLGIANGIMTANEARTLMGLEPIDVLR